MNPGKHRHPVEIYSKTAVKKTSDTQTDEAGEIIETDEAGDIVYSLEKIGRTFCSLKSKTASILYGKPMNTRLLKTTHLIEMRYLNFPKLAQNHLLKINGQFYEIEYLDNRDEMNEIWDICAFKNNNLKDENN